MTWLRSFLAGVRRPDVFDLAEMTLYAFSSSVGLWLSQVGVAHYGKTATLRLFWVLALIWVGYYGFHYLRASKKAHSKETS
jgi:hypothetical protein